MPCSPREPLSRIRSPGRAWSAQVNALRHQADAGSVDEQSIRAAPLHDLRITRNDLHSDVSSRLSQGLDDALQRPHGQTLLENEGRAETERPCPPHGQIVDRPVDGSAPMSPPGKKRGLTTKESVVNARRRLLTRTTAWSSRRASTGFPRAERKTSRINSPESRPPLPWLSRILSPTGTGATRESSG